ncbi:MAG: hypothetical protein U9Q83_05100 [Bacteroidota bacterium]|nr:hypothetical protein [Bacteroidota bacterium]
MKKSSKAERVRRINAALGLIRKYGNQAKAAETLAKEYGISIRQAYRYVNKAGSVDGELPIPDQKVAFTVKLSQSLVATLRQYTSQRGQTLSDAVAQALESFLFQRHECGKKEKRGT